MKGMPSRPMGRKTVRIWADGDACPSTCADALFAAAQKNSILLTLISTFERTWPHSAYIRTAVLTEGNITPRLQLLAMQGDLVVSADTQLVAEMHRRGIATLDPASGLDLPIRLEDLLAELRAQLLSEELADADLARRKVAAQRKKNTKAALARPAG